VRDWLTEGAIVLVVLVAATHWGATYGRASAAAGRQPFFYQSTYEPAVMIACGHGFSVATSPRPALNAFLDTTSDQFSCAQLPLDITLRPAYGQPALSKHLMWAIGLFWRAMGISWSGLSLFAGIMFGLATCVAYGLFRFGMGRVLALLGCALLAVSPLQLLNLPNVPDYSKTPFMLALIALTIGVVRWQQTRQMFLAAAAFGFVLGVGYGFRSDVIVMLPAFAVALLLLAPGALRQTLLQRVSALALCLVVFVIIAWPLLRQRSESGSCQGHVTMLGLAGDFTRALGIVPPIYDVGHAYHDMFAYETAASFAHRRGATGAIEYCSPEHDAAARAFLLTVATTMPADVLARTYASIRKIPELAFGWPDPPLPGWHDGLYQTRSRVVTMLQSTSLVWVGIAVSLVAIVDLRSGLLALLGVLFLGAFPAVQFTNRHHFFLEVVTIWCVLLVISSAWFSARRSEDIKRLRTGPRVARGFALPVAMVLVMLMTLAIARAVQQRSVTRLLDAYLAAPTVPLTPNDLPFDLPTQLGTGQPSALLLATLDAASCRGARLIFQYDATHPDARFFTWSLAVRNDLAGPLRVFVPAYRGFQDVTVEAAGQECVASLARVDVAAPLWVFAALDANWRETQLFQQLAGVFEPYHRTDSR
jgi:hypothetical protein